MLLRKWVVGVLGCILFAQPITATPKYLFRVVFTDKKGAPSLKEAGSFLSQRSLQRRAHSAISLDESDRPVSQAYLEEIQLKTNGRIQSTSKWLNSCVLQIDDSLQITRLHKLPFIASALCVGYYDEHEDKANIDKDRKPGYKLTGSPAYYGASWTQTELVKGDCLHDKGWKGQGILIAVLDDGFHYVDTEPAFDSVYNSGRITDTRNFVAGGTDVYTNFLTHGTEVLSTIAGNLPNTYVGAAPLAQFALYATEDASHEWPVEMDNLVAAFERADSIGADIISTSTGYDNFDAPFQAQSITPAQLDGKTTVAAIGVNAAFSKGMLVVVTAGNEGLSTPAHLLTPGDADSALTIGNVDASKNPSGSSGHGPNAAGQIKPEVCALGNPGFVMTAGSSPFQAFGTSISTPQVAGFAACLWQASVGKTNTELKAAIIRSAHLYANPQMPQLGYGVPDFCTANIILDIPNVSAPHTSVSIYPNPVQESFVLSVNSDKSQTATLSILDLTGKTIFTTTQSVGAGITNIPVTVPHYISTGIYTYRVLLGDRVMFGKLVKQ